MSTSNVYIQESLSIEQKLEEVFEKLQEIEKIIKEISSLTMDSRITTNQLKRWFLSRRGRCHNLISDISEFFEIEHQKIITDKNQRKLVKRRKNLLKCLKEM